MATEGLNPNAVGKVRMTPGEGIVGLVAKRQEPINVANAAEHPGYRYFPETGEQQFSGFLAVPLVHFRQSTGVLVVQQITQRVFAKDEVAFLVTIGSQLAATLSYAALGSAIGSHERGPSGAVGLIQGLPGAPGVTIGNIVLPSPSQSSMRCPTVYPTMQRRKKPASGGLCAQRRRSCATVPIAWRVGCLMRLVPYSTDTF
jgi:phosphotransferase system enzyme I (PtsP)